MVACAITSSQLGLLDASQVARLDRHRTEKGQTKFTQLWLASSRAMGALPPAAFLAARRAEWGIENGLHYVLDVSGDEDRRLHVRTLNNLCVLTLLSRISVALWKESQRGKKWPQSYYRSREHHKARPDALLRLMRTPRGAHPAMNALGQPRRQPRCEPPVRQPTDRCRRVGRERARGPPEPPAAVPSVEVG